MQINEYKMTAKKTVNAMLSILPALFWILLIFAFDTPGVAVMTLLCAAVHEIGHIAAMGFVSTGSSLFSSLSGLRLKTSRLLSYKEEITVAAGGPAMNIVIAIPCLLMHNSFDGYFYVLGVLSLCTALSNLLPIRGYDGYKILSAWLSSRLGADRTEQILGSVSFLFTVAFCYVSLYLMNKADTGYWIFFVFFIILMRSLGMKRI